jgi:hypothetical protein
VTVYPNPAVERFVISMPQGFELGTIELYTPTGQLVRREIFPGGNNYAMHATDLKGLFTIIVKSPTKSWHGKLIIH